MPADNATVYRAALALIETHGELAPIEAANRASSFLARGDDDGSALWKRICFAVLDLVKKAPAPGQMVH